MPATAPIHFTVFPDDCDSYGHLNQASAVRLFERARWAALAAGPGMDAFTRNGVWPAVRKSTVEYRAQAFPGDELRVTLELTHHGHTSFTMRQTAARVGDGTLIAEAEFVFVCVDAADRPAPVPAEISRFFGARPSMRPGETQELPVRGTSLAVDVLGDGDPVLFVHGFPLDRTIWRPMAATLTGRRRIAPDLRGFGRSAPPDGECTLSTYADDLAALLEALGAGRAVVCGHSMGGYIAFEMLRRHRDRVRALVLVNTRAVPDDDEARAARDAMIARVRRDGPGAIVDDLLPRLLAPATRETQPHVVEQVRRAIIGGSGEGVAQALAAMRDRPDSRELLDGIDLPVLVIAGRDDAIVPAAESRAMAAAIPGAHLAMVPDAGHLAPLEQPVNTSRLVGEFLDALA